MTRLKHILNWLFWRLNISFKIVTVNKTSLKETFVTQFKGYQLLSYSLYLLTLISIGIFLLMSYGPIRHLLPKSELSKKEIIDIMIHVDSLERDLFIKKQYIDIINKIVQGEVVDSFITVSKDSTLIINDLNLNPSKADSSLRKVVEAEEFYNIPTGDIKDLNLLENFIFFKPVDGIIVSEFNNLENHFGVDIVTTEGASVKTCLDGVVLFTDWSVEGGNVILIQHTNNLISVYMHNSSVTKKTNDFVKAGEVIGIVGDSGELSSGPHLHFELWQNGTPINPQDYIDF